MAETWCRGEAFGRTEATWFKDGVNVMAYSRNRAISLKAATIGEVLVIAGFVLVLNKLTAAQRQKLQRYLDAVVVDPAVRQEANALYQKGTTQYGELVIVDPADEAPGSTRDGQLHPDWRLG